MKNYMQCVKLLNIINKNCTDQDYYILHYYGNDVFWFARSINSSRLKKLSHLTFNNYEQGYHILEIHGFLGIES